MSTARRRRTREEEELEEIKRQRALSDWNQGNDPALRELSRAEALFTSQGNSAARFAKNKGKVRAAKDAVVNAEPNPNLPERAKESFRRQQLKAGDAYDDFMRDADEFSGKPVGNYEPLKPAWKRREEKRAQAEKDAADYKEKNPNAGRTAIVKDWSADPEVAAARATGNISKIEQATKNARDRDRVARGLPKGPGTAEGDAAALAGKNVPAAPSVAKTREVSVDDLAQGYQDDLLAEAEKRRSRQDSVDNYRRERVLNRLTDSGYDWKSEDSAALFDQDGNINVDRAKRAADLAQGQKAQETFDSWDYDKQLDRDAQAIARDSRSRLRILRSAAREGDLNAAGLAEMQELERTVSLGDNPRNRDGLRAGFWRTEAEDQDRNRIAEVEKFRVLAESQQKQADAVRTRTESVGRPLTDEEIKGLGYPAWDDEVAWQEIIKVNPAAAEVYKMRPVNVSRAGRAMSKALSAFA